MYKVVFREATEQLAAMFNQDFKTEKEAKGFIKQDAEHYAEVHHFTKEAKLVNEDPDYMDYFVLYHAHGKVKEPVLIYQYFRT